THTYLDGTGPFTSLGLWAVGSLHSTATLSIQSAPAACMCLGACTVSIFLFHHGHSAGWTFFFFRSSALLTLTLLESTFGRNISL
ncbi:hypothetical protein K438DRAFT_2130385, partial [Mycena galopus ATCC 62051]